MMKIILTLVLLVVTLTTNANASTINERERDCLIINAFHEAEDSDVGVLSVTNVVHTRLLTGKWGNSYCKVIYAPYQFSWTLDKRKRYTKIDYRVERWNKVARAVDSFLVGMRVPGLEKAISYHAKYVNPSWCKRLRYVATIAGHRFYSL